MAIHTYLFPLLFYTRLATSSSCQDPVFSIPIRDVQVDPTISNSFVIGAATKVGNPEQDVVLFPWAELNDTYLYDQNAFCDGTVVYGDILCHVRRGGFFRESNSASWQQQLDIDGAGGATQETINPSAELGIKDLVGTSLWGNDIFQLDSQKSLTGFPMGIPRKEWDYGYSLLHALGMGPNSTYINALYNAGTIRSHVWSMFYGRWWNSNAVNGSIVLGGYDERLILGKNYTAPLDYTGECFTGLKMNVLGITLNFRNGSDIELLDSETPACIVPTRPNLVGLLNTYSDKFQQMTNMTSIGPSFGMHWASMIFNADAPYYDGDMTFSLSTGLSVRVLNDQIVTPYVGYDRNGSRVFNESQREVLMYELGKNIVTLGRYFLTSAYLTVDYDHNTFTMWNANPTASSSLKATINNDAAPACDNTTTGTGSGPANVASQVGSKVLSTGTIAGTAVGCVIAVGLLVLAAFFVWRRRSQRKHSAPTECHNMPHELYNAHNPTLFPGVSNKWLSKEAPNEAELHQSYIQPKTMELHDTEVARYPELAGSKQMVYEMPDASQLPSRPLIHDRGPRQ